MTNPKEQMMDMMQQGYAIIRLENEQQQAMALINPRNIEKVLPAIIGEMANTPAIAKKFFYSIEYNDAKKTIVEGVSIQGAMAIQRNFQNCASNCRVIEDRPTEVICEGVFIDYQNRNRVMRQVAVSKFYKPAGGNELKPEKRMDVKIAAGMSKAVRNAVINGVPVFVQMKVLEEAKRIAKSTVQADGSLKIRPLPERLADLIADYAEEGVTHEMIKKKLGKEGANERDYDHLLGLLNAIQENFVTVEEVFPKDQPAAAPAGKEEVTLESIGITDPPAGEPEKKGGKK